MKIKDINTALIIFEENAKLHESATNTGDYQLANKSYSKISKVIHFLKNENKVELLELLLDHESLGVKSWAALYLLPVYENRAIEVLEEVAANEGIRGLAAETTLSEWRKGNLKF
jgi:hypothetical protein